MNRFSLMLKINLENYIKDKFNVTPKLINFLNKHNLCL